MSDQAFSSKRSPAISQYHHSGDSTSDSRIEDSITLQLSKICIITNLDTGEAIDTRDIRSPDFEERLTHITEGGVGGDVRSYM
jgi:hypothetical protein